MGNWPRDFDGAIVLYPAWNAAALNLQLGAMTREMAKPGAYMNRDKRKAMLEASLEACDALDGARDGIVANVRACEASFPSGLKIIVSRGRLLFCFCVVSPVGSR